MTHLDRAIVDVVESICSSVLGFDVVETASPAAVTGPGLIARTQVAGAWSGSVVVWCDDGFADACAAVLFDGEVCGPPEARDALGELTNIIAGDAKNRLIQKGYKFEIGLPKMVTGRNYITAQSKSVPCIVVSFTSQIGKFCLEVSLRKAG